MPQETEKPEEALTKIDGVCQVCGKAFSMMCHSEGLAFFSDGMSDGEGFRWVCHDCAHADQPDMAEAKGQIMQHIPVTYRKSDWQQLESISGLSHATFSRLRDWPHTDSFLLCGPSRMGKTRLMCMLLGRYAEEGRAIEFHSQHSFRKGVDEGIRMGYFHDWFDRLASADVLALDDLGKTKGVGKRFEEELFNIIDRRVSAGRTILATTNASKQGLQARFSPEIGGPLVARLDEMCACFVFGLQQEPLGLTEKPEPEPEPEEEEEEEEDIEI